MLRTPLLALLLSLALCAPANALPGASELRGVAGESSSLAATSIADQVEIPTRQRAKKGFRVKAGILINNPLAGPKTQFVINDHIVRLIRKSRPGSTIRIMSWNIYAPKPVRALLRAQERGVRVRVLMDKGNSTQPGFRNPYFTKLRTGLKQGNKHLKKNEKKSRAKLCSHACRRGEGGAAHAKFYTFSKVGKSRDVVVQGSQNLTLAAARNQWNEVYTYVDDEDMYDFASRIHREMWKDKASTGWAAHEGSKNSLYFSPRKGDDYHGDPLLDALKKVECHGAVNAGNANGRTIIRSAPDVFRGDWGMRVARQLKKLWNNGCDIRIGYTIIGIDVKRLLQSHVGRGPVPLRHLVQDFNGDGIFDRYFHTKVWTINGVMGKNRTAFWAQNGSSNVSDLAAKSDENVGVFVDRRSVTRRYQRFVDRWFSNPPRSSVLVGRLAPGVDPYQNIDLD